VRTLRTQALVAFDASGVAGAVVSQALGPRRLKAFAQAPLPRGALSPSPFEPNLADPAAVKAALVRVKKALDLRETAACLLLPAGVARAVLMDVPSGSEAEGYARFRLASALPYPAAEAVVDFMPAGPGRVVAAAVRRSVIQGYEKVAEAAGLRQSRLDLSPLMALGGLLKDSADGARTVDVILGDAAVTLSAHTGGALRAYRTRWRDPGLDEARWLAEEARRTADLAGAGAAVRLRAVGPGASSFVQSWTAAGLDAAPGWELEGHGLPVAAAELCWLGGALS
jgi:hypothetical protein